MSNSKEKSYSGVLDGHLPFGKKPALILIDFIQAYFDPECQLYAGVEDTLTSALRLRELAHQLNIPVILTNVAYQPNFADGGRFVQKIQILKELVKGSKIGGWPAGLIENEKDIVITKQYPSAFFGTTLSSTLTAMGIDCLILTGLTTSGCVRATCVDACSYGFIPYVISDACGDRHPEPHKANLFDMQAKYAEVVTELEAIALLRK